MAFIKLKYADNRAVWLNVYNITLVVKIKQPENKAKTFVKLRDGFTAAVQEDVDEVMALIDISEDK